MTQLISGKEKRGECTLGTYNNPPAFLQPIEMSRNAAEMWYVPLLPNCRRKKNKKKLDRISKYPVSFLLASKQSMKTRIQKMPSLPRCSIAVSDRSTNRAQGILTSEIGRDREMTYAFLDLDLNGAREEYKRAKDFVENCAVKYGLSSPRLEELSGSEKARLRELYESNYEWSSKGPMRVRLPRERVVLKLYDEAAPLAVQNFTRLCSGELGLSKQSRKPLHYAGTPFHRVVCGFVAQTGDIVFGNGTAGESTFAGGKAFKDDKDGLKLKVEKGKVAMCNKGKNSNTSQFFFPLDTKACAKLTGKHVVFGEVVVVFGEVVVGMEVVERLAAVCGVDQESDQDVGLAIKGVALIADSGVLPVDFDPAAFVPTPDPDFAAPSQTQKKGGKKKGAKKGSKKGSKKGANKKEAEPPSSATVT
eukprot:g4721.t1